MYRRISRRRALQSMAAATCGITLLPAGSARSYQINDGLCSVPDAPGFGLAIDESKFGRVRVNFDLQA